MVRGTPPRPLALRRVQVPVWTHGGLSSTAVARYIHSGETGGLPSDGAPLTAGTGADGSVRLVGAGEAPMARTSRLAGGRRGSQQAIRAYPPHPAVALPARNPLAVGDTRAFQELWKVV